MQEQTRLHATSTWFSIAPRLRSFGRLDGNGGGTERWPETKKSQEARTATDNAVNAASASPGHPAVQALGTDGRPEESQVLRFNMHSPFTTYMAP
jgi:hypothetical protein